MAYDRRGFAQQYGYFEIKAKFDSAGGTWPAFWLMPVGTIAFEHYGQFPNAISIALHERNTVAARKNYDAGVNLAADYHVYGLLRNKDNITVYLDGAQVFQAPTPSQMHQPYYLLLTHGEGVGWSQPDSNGPFHYNVIRHGVAGAEWFCTALRVHSMTSSARASSEGGTSRPSACPPAPGSD